VPKISRYKGAICIQMSYISYNMTDHMNLDLILFVVFGSISVLALTGAILCFRKALAVSGEKDGDLKMFFWAFGSMLGLIVSGMSAAYILLPIILHR
jgi:hypothetical protein